MNKPAKALLALGILVAIWGGTAVVRQLNDPSTRCNGLTVARAWTQWSSPTNAFEYYTMVQLRTCTNCHLTEAHTVQIHK